MLEKRNHQVDGIAKGAEDLLAKANMGEHE